MPLHPPIPVQHLPLPFQRGVGALDRDPASLTSRLRRSLPVQELDAADASLPFLHRSASLRAGSLVLHSAAHSALHAVNRHQAAAVFTMPLAGEKRFHLSGRTWVCRAGESSLYLPGEGYSVDTSVASGVILSVAPERLAAAAAALAGQVDRACAPVEHPVLLREDDPRQGHLLAMLRRALGLIDHADLEAGAQLPLSLGLDDLIQRLLALLLHPELLDPRPLPTGLEPADRRAFARLQEALRADPMDPGWNLSAMERFSGLSPQRLQAVCREQIGSDPLRWLRQLRLCQARRELAQGLPLQALPQLALRCGFTGVPAFSRAFMARFQLDPTLLVLPDPADGASA